MIHRYPALNYFLRFGRVIAGVAAILVFLLCAGLDNAFRYPGVWPIVGVVGGLAAAGAVLVLRDIVKVIADTLIPAP